MPRLSCLLGDIYPKVCSGLSRFVPGNHFLVTRFVPGNHFLVIRFVPGNHILVIRFVLGNQFLETSFVPGNHFLVTTSTRKFDKNPNLRVKIHFSEFSI